MASVGDIGENGSAVHRAGLRPRVPADDRDALFCRILKSSFLLDRVAAADDDGVGLQGDRLAQRGRLARHRALAIDFAIVPTDDVGGFLDAMGDAENAPVAHVARDINDRLLARSLGPGSRAIPLIGATGRLFDNGLGLVNERIGARQAQAQAETQARPPQPQICLCP